VAEHPVPPSAHPAALGAALISQYEREPAALQVYGLQLLLIALTRLIVWLYATNRPHQLYEPISRRIKTVGVLLVTMPAALYVLAILIAGSAPRASLAIYAGSLSCTSSPSSWIVRRLLPVRWRMTSPESCPFDVVAG
jgi:hypothetical protein